MDLGASALLGQRNICATGYGGLYDLFIERPPLAKLAARAIWGIDLGPMYPSIDEIGELPAGSTVVDAPCGGGLAMRAIGKAQELRYLGVDIDDKMLERAAKRAADRELGQVETLKADMRDMPLDDGVADLVCCYNGLHMIGDADVAIEEFARVLRPGGRLVGCCIVADGGCRIKAMFKLARLGDIPSPPADATTLRSWLSASGFTEVSVSDGGLAFFSATRK